MTDVRTVMALVEGCEPLAELPNPAARRALRRQAGVPVTTAAAAIGVSERSLIRWERGSHEPSNLAVRRYLAFLACAQNLAATHAA